MNENAIVWGFFLLAIGIVWGILLSLYRDGCGYYDTPLHTFLRFLHVSWILFLCFSGLTLLYDGFEMAWNWKAIFYIFGIIVYTLLSLPALFALVMEGKPFNNAVFSHISVRILGWLLWPISLIALIVYSGYGLVKDTKIVVWVRNRMPNITITWEG